MSAKNLDTHNRWRNKTVAFRVSPEENEQIDAAVRLSGLTKQDYITKRLLCRDVVVQGNPRVYKALRDELATVLAELWRIRDGANVDSELLDTIRMIAAIMGGIKEYHRTQEPINQCRANQFEHHLHQPVVESVESIIHIQVHSHLLCC